MFTNTPQAGPYRGAGRPEAAYFTDGMIEHAAKQIGMDVAEIRRVNLIPPEKFPYSTPTFYTYELGRVRAPARQVRRDVDWKGYEERRKASRGRQAARPLGLLLHRVRRIFNDRMDIRFDSGRHVTVFGGTHSHGQATRRCSPQLVMNFRRAVRTNPLMCRRHRQVASSGAGTYGRAARWSAAARSSAPRRLIIARQNRAAAHDGGGCRRHELATAPSRSPHR